MKLEISPLIETEDCYLNVSLNNFDTKCSRVRILFTKEEMAELQGKPIVETIKLFHNKLNDAAEVINQHFHEE